MNAGHWTAVRVRTTTDRSAVVSALFEVGAESVQELEDGIVTHILDVDRAMVSATLARADRGATVEYAPTPTVDWSKEWRSHIAAHRLGRLVVTPPWRAQEFSAEERIVIEPGMAFGTGEHETTRGVVRLLQRVIRANDTVADLGAGSAVLSIAAAKLGATRVIAIELDEDAIENAEENVVANGVAAQVSVIQGDAAILLPLVAPVRVVVANIVSSVLLELLAVIDQSLTPDGVAILSGVLSDERHDMQRALSAAGWRVQESDEEGQWWSATIVRR